MVNIFGGIVDCSIVANGITSAYKRLNVKVPVVVRLEGENGFHCFDVKVVFVFFHSREIVFKCFKTIFNILETHLKNSRLFTCLEALAASSLVDDWLVEGQVAP